MGVDSVRCEEIKGLHGDRGRQHYGDKCETGRMIPWSGCVMGGQQDVILMLIRKSCSWGHCSLKALKFISLVTLNLILAPSW